MKISLRFAIILACLMLSLNAQAQLQIVASGPTDVCFPNAPTLSVVNPPTNLTYQWFVVVGSCFNHNSVVIGTSTSIQANGTSGYFCVGTDPGGNAEVSNTIFVRVLPGSIGSLMLPLPYSSTQVSCLPSIDLCIPYEMAPQGFVSTIKWYRNNVQIAGASTLNYTATLAGYYKYSVSNSCATSFSDSVEFISPSSVPQFTTTAVSPVCNGNTINFTVTNPIPGATYTWQTSNFSSSGFVASGSGINFSYIVPSALNLYVRLQCVTTGCGVQITPATGFTIQNISRQISPFATQNLCPGGTVNFSINPTGGVTGIQWKRNGTSIPGATQNTYPATIAGIYSADVTASCGVASSNSVTVNAASAPAASISANGPLTFCAGSNVILNANSGTGLSYQWKKYANVIAGATTSSLTATGAGKYKCIVTNAAGCSKASNTVTVIVNPLPTATITAAGQTTFCVGGSVVLSANTGTGLTYQWKKYANNIGGAINSSYTATAAGKYKCTVTNANGCSKGSNAITVSVPCRIASPTTDNSEMKAVLYPNPSDGTFEIKINNSIPEPFDISITDLSGRLIKSEFQFLSDRTIVISNLETGMYFVILSGENERIVLKAIVKN
ncbi:MAG: T9SS type A sorting domain-containing protein [Bacteroidetes bacterium]|nr:T9SS type A sorting domain-containing protein [Bacteroidota bacterium]